MAKSFMVMIVTPDKVVYEGEAVSASIPGLSGYLGVWANHAPLVGAVVPGVVRLKTGSGEAEAVFSVGLGFVEISDNVVHLMTDTCEAGDEVDTARAESALERARQHLVSMDKELNRERARMAVMRARARLAVNRARP